MIVLPAIDLIGGQCVRLAKGEFSTAHKVAEDPFETARMFAAQGASWVHIVDLDGARTGSPANREVIKKIAAQLPMQVECGGGIRSMVDVDELLGAGIGRVVIGSAAIEDFAFLSQAAEKYPGRIAVGLDAFEGRLKTRGWERDSGVNCFDFALKAAEAGVKYAVYTDISKDGMLCGPDIEGMKRLVAESKLSVISSGGVSSNDDLYAACNAGAYGAITGKAVYTGGVDISCAVALCERGIDSFFKKSELIPAIVQDAADGTVLMLAYMDRESLELTLKTRETWFYSRSRKELWHKGGTSGNIQKVVSIHGDCDSDTLLIRAVPAGPACHTGSKSCFFDRLLSAPHNV